MKEYILKNEKKLVIRLAEEKDAEGLLVHINQAGRETDFLGFGKEGYDKDIEDEKKYIKSFTPKNFMLVAVIDDEIIASCSIGAREERIRLKHMGNLGICVQKKAWGIGVGKYLMEYALEKAKEGGLTKVNLDVRIDNEKAIHLYEKFGFEKEGTIKKCLFIDGVYYDNYIMGREV